MARKNINQTARQFAARYGTDESKLAGWQRLCSDIGVVEGRSITQCKKALRGVYVNLVDLIHAVQAGRDVPRHASRQALRDYISSSTGKTFPKSVAKENGILKALLIDVW